jgi:hypothetical protein
VRTIINAIGYSLAFIDAAILVALWHIAGFVIFILARFNLE